MTNDLILMKLGGSLITNKQSDTPKYHNDIMRKIANIISESNKKIIIVHGVGSYGHPIAKKYNIDKGIDETSEQKEAIIKARNQIRDLNKLLCCKIMEKGVKCDSIIPSETMELNIHRELEEIPKEKFDKILSKNKIAITFGDIVNTKEGNVSILSGDTLLLKLAQVYKPKRTYFIMDYPGVVKGSLNSKKIKIYKKIDSAFIKSISITEHKNRPDVTGGLLNKIKCALEISKISECWISGLDNLESCINGSPIGTMVTI